MQNATPRSLKLPLPASTVRQLALLGLFTAYCLTLLALRYFWTDKLTFRFLIWNIFLAWMPVFFSTVATILHRCSLSMRNQDMQQDLSMAHNRRPFLQNPSIPLLLSVLCLIPWLLFLPNAPYIITDLIHLRPRPGVPYWYDILLISSFAFNGLLLGFYSMQQVHALIRLRFKPIYGWALMGLAAAGSAYGIYLGRVLRWNSWDVLRNPLKLAGDCMRPFLHPFAYKEAVVMTVMLTGFLFLGYLVYYQKATHSQKG